VSAEQAIRQLAWQVDDELPKLASPLGENWTAASFFSGFRVDSALNFALLHASFVDELEKIIIL